MQIYLTSAEPERLAQLATHLEQDLQAAELTDQITYRVQQDREPQRGEPVTTAMIILAMVGAGGFLTVAAGKGGALTWLAQVLETYINRDKVDVTLEADGEKIALSGSARYIEKMLSKVLKDKDS